MGLIPLAFSDTSLFQLRYFPMARTVMGGLMASTILTLVVLPTYYILFDDLGIWLRQIWQASSPGKSQDTRYMGFEMCLYLVSWLFLLL